MTDRRTAIAFAATLGAVVGLSTADATAQAGDYVCNIPHALLCDGCASQVSITLVQGGTCRISFTPAAAGAPAGATSFSFHVLTPAVVAARPRPAAAAPAAPSSKCFVFNGNQYCERP